MTNYNSMKYYERQYKKKEFNYLKYWAVVRAYAKHRYSLSASDLDMLFFLYTEGYFTKEKFTEYSSIMSWDKGRFQRLVRLGYIEVFRKRIGHHCALYDMSYKGKRVVNDIYKKLEGEPFSEHYKNNPLFKGSATKYSEKVTRELMKKLNAERRATIQRQHLFPE